MFRKNANSFKSRWEKRFDHRVQIDTLLAVQIAGLFAIIVSFANFVREFFEDVFKINWGFLIPLPVVVIVTAAIYFIVATVEFPSE